MEGTKNLYEEDKKSGESTPYAIDSDTVGGLGLFPLARSSRSIFSWHVTTCQVDQTCGRATPVWEPWSQSTGPSHDAVDNHLMKLQTPWPIALVWVTMCYHLLWVVFQPYRDA